MKIRTIKLTSKILIDALQGKPGAHISNLPSDAEILHIEHDLSAGQIMAIVRSDSFKDIPDAYPIPEFNLIFFATSKTAASPTLFTQKSVPSQTAASVTGEPKPAKKAQTEPVMKNNGQVQKKQNTCLMEEEFSAEQRKLLSFSVDGNFLVVKPVKFLKAEWEDINEVVRSLGGRWVKGDIISFWEVPL